MDWIRGEGVKTLLPSNDYKLLIDGDMLIYRAAWATNDKPQYESLISLIGMMNDIMDKLDSDDYVFYLSSKTNFRNEVYPLYKANRVDVAKPIHKDFLRGWVENHYRCESKDGLEADDLIADNVDENKTIVVTQDKDLKQLVGFNYDFVKKILCWVDEEEAHYLFSIQTLTGDRVDNIPGLSEKAPKRGIGPAGAKKILSPENVEAARLGTAFKKYEWGLADVILLEYEKKYGDDAVYMMAVNAYMLKVGSFNRAGVLKQIREYEDGWS